MRFNSISKVILFGGSATLIGIAEMLKLEGIKTIVYTSPRHAAEVLNASGETLLDMLNELSLSPIITEDINKETSHMDEISPNTLGLGIGEAWSFSAAIIDKFGGRLLDFMGIPLPRYRGGAHYTWMILRDDRKSGCNLQIINDEMVQGLFDSGEIVKSKKYVFPKAHNPQEYFEIEVREGVAFIKEFISEVKKCKDFDLKKIDENQSLYLPRLNSLKQGWIDWSWSGEEIERFICAFDDPYKGASTRLVGERVHLKGATLDTSEAPFHPFQSGIITRVIEKEGVVVATTSGHLKLKHVLSEDSTCINTSLRAGARFYTPPNDLHSAMEFYAVYGTSGLEQNSDLAIKSGEFIAGKEVSLRLVTMEDCTQRYVSWLRDPKVNQYLETRWSNQTIETIREFVNTTINCLDNYLFAIIENKSSTHIGNIKIGHIDTHHSHATVSYFIGERSSWGKGYAKESVRLITQFGFNKLKLHRLQAGVYASHAASKRVLEKVGYKYECSRKAQLKGANGWEDHLLYGLLREDWTA
jgi:RimJ/RimL family protein N-acetyltransferase/methionyl-tRNA formyltransferase